MRTVEAMPYSLVHRCSDDRLVDVCPDNASWISNLIALLAERMAKAYDKNPEDLPAKLSVISWVLPIVAKTRQSNRRQKDIPSRPWSHTRWHGEHFNDALREYVVRLLTEMGYLAVAPVMQPFFKVSANEKGDFSNWSGRHTAYAA